MADQTAHIIDAIVVIAIILGIIKGAIKTFQRNWIAALILLILLTPIWVIWAIFELFAGKIITPRMAADTSNAARQETAAPDAQVPAIELRGISKSFGPVQANKDISVRVMPGTIHGIIGENGAGKSTLMSILYGFYKADAGEIFIGGRATAIPDSQAAIAAGIGMVFQHFKLVENFTVLENIILGAEDGRLLRPSLAKARAALKALAAEYELNVDPDAVIEDIGVGMQQRVEILKALYRQADILIFVNGGDKTGHVAAQK